MNESQIRLSLFMVLLVIIVFIIVQWNTSLQQNNPSNGNLFLQITVASGCSLQSMEELTIRVQSGSTVKNALESARCEYVKTLIIELEGEGPYTLPSDFSFFPTSVKCENIIIRGDISGGVNDTIVATNPSGPFDSWLSLEISNTLVSGDWESGFVYNSTTKSYSVIDTNDANNVEVVNGNTSLFNQIYFGVDFQQFDGPDVLSVNDEIIIYNPVTRVEFSSIIDISSDAHITFERIIFQGDVDASLRSDKEITMIKGCRLNINSAADVDGSYGFLIGKFDLEGIYAYSDIQDAQINTASPDNSFHYRSLYTDGLKISCKSEASAYYIKMQNPWRHCMLLVGGNLELVAADLYGGINSAGWCTVLKCWELSNLSIGNSRLHYLGAGILSNSLLGLDSGSHAIIKNCSFYSDNQISNAIHLEANCSARWFNTQSGNTDQGTYGCNTAVTITGNSLFDCVRPKEFEGITGHLYNISRNSKLILINGGRVITNGTTTVAPINLSNNAQLEVFSNFLVYEADPGVPAIQILNSSGATVSQFNIVNNIGSAELIVGANGLTTYTSQNDYAEVGTQNCYFTIY